MDLDRLRKPTVWGEWLTRAARIRELRILVFLALAVLVTTLIQPNFLSLTSVRSILLWTPLILVVSLGEMMVIITRGIDVSVGSMVGLTGMVVGMLFRDMPGFGIYQGLIVGIILGLLLGAINGSLVTWARVPAVVVTLGGLSLYRGLAFLISGGVEVAPNFIPRDLTRWTEYSPFHNSILPWIVIIAAALALLAFAFLHFTIPGRDIYAVGCNPEAAYLRGRPVKGITFLVYAITGALSGLTGLLYASRFGFVNPGQTGVGMELTVVAVVVIGGVSVLGGSGSVLGVVLGCLLLATLNVALNVLGIPTTWQGAIYGLTIIFAVSLDLLVGGQLHPRVATTRHNEV